MIPNIFDFYSIFLEKFEQELNEISIGVLSDFRLNQNNIELFNAKYIYPNKPKIVICGINPGRYGAGKTGIPFVDFNSLSKMLPSVNMNDSEKTASFFFKVIEYFEIKNFYRNFHVTNLSCIGFYDKRTRKNINYDVLPTHIAKYLLERFVSEMKLLEPKIIIPLGRIVEWELTLNLKKNGLIDSDIHSRLHHPASRLAKFEDYIQVLNNQLNH